MYPDTIKQTWRVFDYEKECPFDLDVNFIDKAFSLTDLNKDGKAEIWIMYKVVCRSDVSPSGLKIIMYEDGRKFAIRGSTEVKFSELDKTGGEFSFDEAFKKGPSTFRNYAENLWKQYKMETWGK